MKVILVVVEDSDIYFEKFLVDLELAADSDQSIIWQIQLKCLRYCVSLPYSFSFAFVLVKSVCYIVHLLFTLRTP